MKRTFFAIDKKLTEEFTNLEPQKDGAVSSPKLLDPARKKSVAFVSVSDEAWQSVKFELANQHIETRELKGDLMLSPVVADNLHAAMESLVNYMPPEYELISKLLLFAKNHNYYVFSLKE